MTALAVPDADRRAWADRREQRRLIEEALEHTVTAGAIVRYADESRERAITGWRVIGVDNAGDRHRHPTLWLIDKLGANVGGYRTISARYVVVIAPAPEHAAIREALFTQWAMLNDADAADRARLDLTAIPGSPTCAACRLVAADHPDGPCSGYVPRLPVTMGA